MAVQALKKPAGPKDLYELGEIPPLGHVPERMYAWAIRKERHGPPESAMQIEAVPTWTGAVTSTRGSPVPRKVTRLTLLSPDHRPCTRCV